MQEEGLSFLNEAFRKVFKHDLSFLIDLSSVSLKVILEDFLKTSK